MTRPCAPLFATINVTGICNLECGYCFYQPRSNEVMRLDDFQEVIDELSNLSVFFVNLSGGEPFTHPQIDKFIRYAHERFQHVIVITNGTILLPQHIQAIEEVTTSKGYFPIQVSIDSVDPQVNAKTRCDPKPVLANLQKLSEIGANIVIAIVVSRFNVDDIAESIIQLSEFTKFFHLMPFQPVMALGGSDKIYRLSEDEIATFWQRIHKLRENLGLHIDTPLDDEDADVGCASGAPCMAAFSHLVIDPDMRVRPCDRLVETTIGNLRNSTLLQIWNSEAAMNILKRTIPLCKV